jgi:hypothetical protein
LVKWQKKVKDEWLKTGLGIYAMRPMDKKLSQEVGRLAILVIRVSQRQKTKLPNAFSRNSLGKVLDSRKIDVTCRRLDQGTRH